MAFFKEGSEGIGAVTEVTDTNIVVYVENSGPFTVPKTAVKKVHDNKVIIDAALVSPVFLKAVTHAHDAEDPKLVG